MTDWRQYYGPNAGWVAELYERYRRDPAAVDSANVPLMGARWFDRLEHMCYNLCPDSCRPNCLAAAVSQHAVCTSNEITRE